MQDFIRLSKLLLIGLMMASLAFPAAAQPKGGKKEPLPSQLENVTLMDVARVEVVNEYEMQNEPPFVDPKFPVPLADAIKSWAEQSFIAAGDSGMLKIIIKEASTQESHYEDAPRFFGLFPGKRMDKYQSTGIVQLKLYDGRSAMPRSEVEAIATREGRIEAAAGIGYREDLFRIMTNDMIRDLDQQTRTLTYKFFHERVKDSN